MVGVSLGKINSRCLKYSLIFLLKKYIFGDQPPVVEGWLLPAEVIGEANKLQW